MPSYGLVMKEVFPQAKISIDRFHVIQQLTRALNKQRIQAMKKLTTSHPETKKLKRPSKG